MKVKMINSVGEYEAGEEYDLESGEGEHFVVCGYAEGELEREVPDEERQQILGRNQSVGMAALERREPFENYVVNVFIDGEQIRSEVQEVSLG